MSKKRKQPATSGSSDRFVVCIRLRKEPDLRRLARFLINRALNGEVTESTGPAATKAILAGTKTTKREQPARHVEPDEKEAA